MAKKLISSSIEDLLASYSFYAKKANQASENKILPQPVVMKPDKKATIKEALQIQHNFQQLSLHLLGEEK